eukprot:12389045-Ditylum_brightwellii.AAC.1
MQCLVLKSSHIQHNLACGEKGQGNKEKEGLAFQTLWRVFKKDVQEVWKCHNCLTVEEEEIDLNFKWKCEECNHLTEEMEE